ncbi:MAG: hypothetical protein KatS3mg112_0878 [Thermogutta sp.]|nr:MAG: hypothetical protein KatS3mg112_0878 [Thermogutta sp.]
MNCPHTLRVAWYAILRVGAIHESPPQQMDHGQMDRIAVGAIHESPLPVNARRAGESRWLIHPGKTDLTSGALRKVGGARLSCPGKGNGLSNLERRPRRAGPSVVWIGGSGAPDRSGRFHVFHGTPWNASLHCTLWKGSIQGEDWTARFHPGRRQGGEG